MTLTEQWKKGELESGWYYVKGEKMYEGISIHWIDYPIPAIEKRCIQEVLAPVQSYNEYLESEAHCAVYSEVNELLKEENEQLKKLLKECQYMILAYSINHDTFTKEKVLDIIKQIDNATGEK